LNAVCKVRGTQISKKSRSHLKKLGARRVMWSKFNRLCYLRSPLFWDCYSLLGVLA
jgi:hypothetical protein